MIIVGLPGSGKTWLAQHEFVTQGFHLLDDVCFLERSRLEEQLQQHTKIVLTDPTLLSQHNRELLSSILTAAGFLRQHWIFFENDWQSCRTNLAARSDSRGHISVDLLSRIYHIPDNSEIRKVFKNPAQTA